MEPFTRLVSSDSLRWPRLRDKSLQLEDAAPVRQKAGRKENNMKLNFKEWSMILEALRDKAEQAKSNLRYYDDEEDETHKRYARELAAVTNIINKIESYSI